MKTTRKVDKREQHIKKKLTAAILMLLISSIMTVTSTYAWFTLSTAPEVTGIQTTIGGNGNLEIALANGTDWESSKEPSMFTEGAVDLNGDTYVDVRDSNITWGNIVDLGTKHNYYGLSNISLYPSRLSIGTSGKVESNILSVPSYGTDGRITSLNDDSTVSGTYNSKESYFGVGGLGVRAIGTASGMTTRQLSYRNAVSALNSKTESAKSTVSASMNQTDGGTLAGVAIKHGMSDGTNEEYTLDEVKSIGNLITGLENSLIEAEQAILAAMDGYVSSLAGQSTTGGEASSGKLSDAEYVLFKAVLYSLDIDKVTVSDDNTVTVEYESGKSIPITNEKIATTIRTYQRAASEVTLARKAYNEITPSPVATDTPADTKYSWSQITGSMAPLINMEGVRVNGMKVSEILADTDAFAKTVMSSGGGVNVSLGSGSGVYYDIASMVGNFSSNIVISKIQYGSMEFTDMPAKISTNFTGTAQLVEHLALIKALEAPSSAGSTDTQKITDFYAYAIDLYLRTNASDTTLMLSDAAQRIYSDSNLEETQGKGSNMTFKSTNVGFGTESMLSLMEAVKIVFMQPDGTIIKYGCLDVDNAVVLGEEVTAEIKAIETVISVDGDTTSTTETLTDNIMKLEQNVATKLTVLVYLDGDKVQNKDVANGIQSVTGTMNLQFKTDATLTPMEYKDLHVTNGTGSTTKQTLATPTTPTYDAATNKLTFYSVANATSYSYSINGATAIPVTFAADSTSTEVTLDTALKANDVVTFTASATDYNSSSSTYTHQGN